MGRSAARSIAVAAAGEAVEHADHAADLVPGVVQRGDRRERRAAGRDDVLDDHAAVPGAQQRALDAALQPVRLGVLAHEEGLRAGAPGERGAGERVGAHRHAADRRAAPRGHLRREQHGERAEALRAQDRALGVDVVVGASRRS